MKKLIAGIAALGFCLTTSSVAKAQEFIEFEHKNNRYYYKTLNSEGAAYYKYKVPAYTLGVFTLKNNSRRSNFDIYAYEYSGEWELLKKGKKEEGRRKIIDNFGTKIDLFFLFRRGLLEELLGQI